MTPADVSTNTSRKCRKEPAADTRRTKRTAPVAAGGSGGAASAEPGGAKDSTVAGPPVMAAV